MQGVRQELQHRGHLSPGLHEREQDARSDGEVPPPATRLLEERQPRDQRDDHEDADLSVPERRTDGVEREREQGDEDWAVTRVSSVRDGAGQELAAVHDRNRLFVRLPAALSAGEVVTLDVAYAGDLIEPLGGGDLANLYYTTWETGPSGFGYGDEDDATLLDDMKGSYSTVYVRKRFTLADPGAYSRFWLSVRVDDGCVAYLNGREIGRVNLDDRPHRFSFDAVADVSAEPFAFDLEIDTSWLKSENLLAVQGFNSNKDSGDFSLIPVLRAEQPPKAIDRRFDDLRPRR